MILFRIEEGRPFLRARARQWFARYAHRRMGSKRRGSACYVLHTCTRYTDDNAYIDRFTGGEKGNKPTAKLALKQRTYRYITKARRQLL